MGNEAAPADPPFAVGQRVRCNVRTTTQRRALYHTVELYGRAGTVVEVAWYQPSPRSPGFWVVLVDYDLGRAFGLWRHEAAELTATEDWRYG